MTHTRPSDIAKWIPSRSFQEGVPENERHEPFNPMLEIWENYRRNSRDLGIHAGGDGENNDITSAGDFLYTYVNLRNILESEGYEYNFKIFMNRELNHAAQTGNHIITTIGITEKDRLIEEYNVQWIVDPTLDNLIIIQGEARQGMKAHVSTPPLNSEQLPLNGVRQSGRTTRAIHRCLEVDGVYVVHERFFAQQLGYQYPNLRVEVVNSDNLIGEHRPIFYDHYVTEKFGYVNENSEGFIKPLKKEFKVSELITLKLERTGWTDGRLDRPLSEGKERLETNIYINNVKFRQCKYLLLNLDMSNKELMKRQEQIDSIDEAAELLGREMEHDHCIVDAETEFWGHCSNLQVFCENDYDVRILHSSLSLPLCVELVKHGEMKARESIVQEITSRIMKGSTLTSVRSYFKYFTIDEFEDLHDMIQDDPNLIKQMFTQLWTYRNKGQTFWGFGCEPQPSQDIRVLETPLIDLTNELIVRGDGRIERRIANGSNIFLGALITSRGDGTPDIELAMENDIIEGVVIGQAHPYMVDLRRDADNPFSDNESLLVNTNPNTRCWCLIGNRYEQLEMSDVIGRSYNEVIRRFRN